MGIFKKGSLQMNIRSFHRSRKIILFRKSSQDHSIIDLQEMYGSRHERVQTLHDVDIS